MRSSPRLQEPLDRLYREFDWAARADLDAIRFPIRYPDPADREVVALLSTCMAYGRVDLFGPRGGRGRPPPLVGGGVGPGRPPARRRAPDPPRAALPPRAAPPAENAAGAPAPPRGPGRSGKPRGEIPPAPRRPAPADPVKYDF